MHSEIFVFPRESDELQRVQLVRFDDWSDLDSLSPPPFEGAFNGFYNVYRHFIVPIAPWKFGNFVMFRLPKDLEIPTELARRYQNSVTDPLTVTTLLLRRGVSIVGGKAIVWDKRLKPFWDELVKRDCVRIVLGKLPTTAIIPVADRAGLLTDAEGALKVNASFFILDPIDCTTPYDHVSTPFGLLVKDGTVESPPLFGREALLAYNDGRVSIRKFELNELRIRIGSEVFIPGENADIFSRPTQAKSTFRKKSLVIIGRRIAAVLHGSTRTPSSGFVLCPRGECHAAPGDIVTYEGLEDVRFGIQVGNSILRGGVPTREFISPFYDFRGRGPVTFPPSLYPTDFEKARAARIALGADRDGKPMLLWVEGAAKFGHIPGKDSCGAALAEMPEICEKVGMYHAVNLDGGGSAHLLVNNRRSLQISDRNADDFTEAERPVPLGLVIR